MYFWGPNTFSGGGPGCLGHSISARKLTYPPKKALLKMMFLFPRWDMYPFPGGQHQPSCFVLFPRKKAAAAEAMAQWDVRDLKVGAQGSWSKISR